MLTLHPMVTMSPNPTQGVDQCYVNPRCWAWQTSCDDSTSATEPPSLPSKIIFRLPRSSRLFFKVCIGNSATVSLDPLDHFAQETDIKQMYQRSTRAVFFKGQVTHWVCVALPSMRDLVVLTKRGNSVFNQKLQTLWLHHCYLSAYFVISQMELFDKVFKLQVIFMKIACRAGFDRELTPNGFEMNQF